MKIEKKHENTIIYGYPEGRLTHITEDLEEFEVVKVKRKYAELKRQGFNSTNNYHLETGATQSSINAGYGINCGYTWFESKGDYEEYKEKSLKYKKLDTYLREWHWNRNQMSDAVKTKLYHLLNDENLLGEE